MSLYLCLRPDPISGGERLLDLTIDEPLDRAEVQALLKALTIVERDWEILDTPYRKSIKSKR